MIGIILCVIAVFILVLVGKIKAYVKMGLPGWAVIIPIYSDVVLYRLYYGKGWKFIYQYIPIYGCYVKVMMGIRIAKSFGEDGGFGWGLGLLPPLFWAILGLGKYRLGTIDKEVVSSWLKKTLSEINIGGAASATQTSQADQTAQTAQNTQGEQVRKFNERRCRACGVVNDDDAVFCVNCGSRML